jgi:hypothetical protein
LDEEDSITTGSSWQFKAPVAGRYLVTSSLYLFCAGCTTIPNADYASMVFVQNGTQLAPNAAQRFDWQGGLMALSGSDVLALAANDALQVRFVTNGSNSTATGGDITITRIGD